MFYIYLLPSILCRNRKGKELEKLEEKKQNRRFLLERDPLTQAKIRQQGSPRQAIFA